MSKTILGVNLSHNSSVSLIVNGKLKYFIEEERISRLKRDFSPYKSLINVLTNYSIDICIISGSTDPYNIYTTSSPDCPFYSISLAIKTIIEKYQPKCEFSSCLEHHHLTHALTSFSHSGFKKSAALVIDGSGTCSTQPFDKNISGIHLPSNYLDPYGFHLKDRLYKWETESIFHMEVGNHQIKYKNYGTNFKIPPEFREEYQVSSEITIAKAYEAITEFLGWETLEGGKTMGLSSYGKENSSLPHLLNKEWLYLPLYPKNATLTPQFKSYLSQKNISQEDLAWKIQNDTQEKVSELIEKTLSLTGLSEICCSGGYFLNCVANYHFVKHFPNVKFYFDPLCYDAGLSLGSSYMENYDYNKVPPLPLTSLYLGPTYSTDQYLNTLKNYNNMFNQYKVTPDQVAKLISERNIVTIFQGRSEAGPRALGNRSILYDPTDPNGRDFVNKVKKREWFRPFAGTVLLEKAHEYFDMAGLEESPFMMYAMDVWPNKQEEIRAITHVDGTCRVQTLTQEQNPHYYKLIQEFEKITGTPILFNTSFNLAGDPLVETIEDALETMLKSEMKYMYVPELEMLLEKK